MIKVGKKTKVKYWGEFEVEKVITLKQPVICKSDEVGEAEFMPTLVKIKWNKNPSPDKNDLWFPYWIKIKGKEKYGQFAPMIGKNALLELLKGAINQDFFDQEFLQRLDTVIQSKIKPSI
jgi:hypothetical protein